MFYSPIKEENNDIADAEGNLEIAPVSSYENGKKSRDDDDRVNAKNVVESQHTESDKNQQEVEGTHEVRWKVTYRFVRFHSNLHSHGEKKILEIHNKNLY